MPKRKSLKTLKKEAWNAFSKFIRQRDMSDDGYIYCVTCGTPKEFGSTDAGHWLSRGWSATLFEETNVYGQCKPCNGFKGGRPDDMERHIAKIHGAEEVERLRELKHQICKRTASDYEEIIKKYKKKYEELL